MVFGSFMTVIISKMYVQMAIFLFILKLTSKILLSGYSSPKSLSKNNFKWTHNMTKRAKKIIKEAKHTKNKIQNTEISIHNDKT